MSYATGFKNKGAPCTQPHSQKYSHSPTQPYPSLPLSHTPVPQWFINEKRHFTRPCHSIDRAEAEILVYLFPFILSKLQSL